MKKISLLIFILIVTTLSSCKKKENTPQATNNGTPNTNTSGNYGVFLSRKQVSYSLGNISNLGGFSTAYVSNTALVNNNPVVGSLLDMGNVSLNGISFKKNGFSVSGYYNDTTQNTFNTPLNWVISGSGAVQSFSYSNNSSYPNYTGYADIVDTYTILGGITIPLNNYTGSDEIETYFVTSTTPSTNTTIKKISGSPTSLSFTAAELSTIGVANNVVLVINFYKNNTQTINGKTYNFRTSYGFLRQNISFV